MSGDIHDRISSLVAQVRAWVDPSEHEHVWLVGGVVRDAILGRLLPDIDLVTSGDPQRLALNIRAAMGVRGAVFELGDRHGCWRINIDLEASAKSVTQIDVCALRRGSIEADVALRDFTANALAINLADGEIIDVVGGVAAIESETVTMVSAQSLDDDPLRMLRAARFAHQLAWDIEPETMQAIRSRARRIAEPAGERISSELEQILLHREARRGWRLIEQLGLDSVLLPELEACRGIEQSRFHHLDVHGHTLAVLDNCDDILDATSFWLPISESLELVPPSPWSRQQRLAVLYAALCHDLGKPATMQRRSDGRVSFVGHDDVGMGIVTSIAQRLKWSGALQRSVSTLVGSHLALGYLLHGPQDDRARWTWAQDVAPLGAEAIVLSVGDRLATAGPDDRRSWVRAHLQLARTLWIDHWRRERDGVPRPLLDGREIAQVAGIELGPRVGELVMLLAREQAVGAVTTREDAEQCIRELTSESTIQAP